MADWIEFLPLVKRPIDEIRSAIDNEANAGLFPEDDTFVDLTEGGFYWDQTQAPALEIERLWDFVGTEVPAAVLPQFSYGDHLDDWAEALGLERKAATFATGLIQFAGTIGTLLASGIEVATPQTDPDLDPPVFATTASSTIPGPLTVPTTLAGTAFTTGGNLATATYYYRVTAIDGEGGETPASTEINRAVTGPTGRVDLTWTAVAGAAGYRIYRGTAAGVGTRLAEVTTALYSDTGIATVAGIPPAVNSTGGKKSVAIKAQASGSRANVAIGALSELLSPIGGVTLITNLAATAGGTDTENDERLRERVLLEFSAAQGAGNADDYKRWALEYAGVGYAKVEPVWNGAGTVRVIVTDPLNDPVATSVVTGLQALLDPIAAQGAGKAPIGATVTVATPTALTINVAATITPRTGYSLDGTSGTVAIRTAIATALRTYIDALIPGGDNTKVLANRVEATILSVEGVYNVAGVALNGQAVGTDVTVGSLQVPTFGTATLT